MPLRRIGRWVLGVIIGVLLLVVTSALVVETPWFKERLRRLAVNRAAEALNGELTIGRLSGSLWTGVALDDVALTQRTGPVLKVNRIELRYDPRLLIHGHLVFASLRLLHPVVRIAQSGEGWNVATLVKPSQPNGKPVTIQFNALSIEDGQVSVEPASAAARHFDAVNANLGLSYSSGELKIDANRFTARDRDTGWTVNRATANYASRDGQVRGRYDLATSAGAVSGTIASDGANGTPRLTAALSVTSLDMAPILADARLKTDVTGKLQAEITQPAVSSESSTIAFQIGGASVSALGYAARDVRGQGSYGDGVLHLDMSGAAYGAEATIRGEWRSASAASRPNTLALAGRFSGLDIRRLPAALDAPPLASRLAGGYQFSYAPSGWDVSLRLAPSTMEGAEIGDGTRVHASMHGTVPSYELQGHLAGLNVQRFSRPLRVQILGEPRFQSSLTGDVHVTGHGRTLDKTSLEVEANLTDSTVGNTHFPTADIGAQLDGPRLIVRFSGPFEHLDNQLAGLTATPLDLNGSSDGVQVVFHDLHAPLTPASLDADGRVNLTHSTVAGYAVDEAAIDAALADGVAQVRTFSLKGAELDATAQGVVGFSGDTASDLNFTLDAQSLDAAAQRFGQPLAGGAHIEGRLSGSPDRLSATGSIGLQQLKYGGSFTALAINGTFGAEVVDQRWSEATAHADTTATFVTLAGQDIQQMTTKASYGAGRLDVDTKIEQKDRTVDLAGNVLFEPEQDEVRLQRLAIAIPNQIWALPAGHQAVIQYGGRRISVRDLTLSSGPEQVAVDGALAIGEGGAVAAEGLDVRVQGVQLADVNRMLSGTRTFAGELNGTAHIQGTLAQPVLQSQLTVTNGAVQNTTFQSLTAKAGYQDDQLTIDATLDVQAGASLTASGHIPLSLGGSTDSGSRPLDLRVESTPIHLGIFQALTSEVTAVTGTGEFNLHVTGTPRAPQLAGQVALVGAGFQVPASGVAYTNGNVHVRFDGDRVAIDEFTLQDDDRHTLRIEGGAEVAGVRQVQNLDIHVISDEIHLMRNKFGELDLSTDLRATGALSQVDVTGTLRVQRGRFEIDKLLEQFTSSAYSTRAEESVAAPASAGGDPASPAPTAQAQPIPASEPAEPKPALSGTPYENATIDVKIRMPQNVILRAQDLRPNGATVGLGSTNLTIGGTLTVDKPKGGNLMLLGGVEVVRGFYDFQGRRFDIGRGSEVQFHGTEPIDPALNISATRDITGVMTEVAIKGTARQPELQLSSQPPLDESDILSLIVFGQPVNALGESQRVNLAQRAGSLALGALAGPLAESVGSALNLDLFEIRAEGESGAPEVALGSQLGSRAFIGLRQEFGTEDVSVVSFEYRFSRLLRLVTSVAQGTQQTHTMRRNDPTGLDLIYVIRY